MDTDNNVFELIDSFAKELLALNGNKKIPAIWMTRLKGQLQKTLPTKPDVKRVYEEIREVVKQVTLHSEEIRAKRTKHHPPSKAKNRTASELNVSQKKVDRIIGEQKWLDSLAPETRKLHSERKALLVIANIPTKLDAEPCRASRAQYLNTEEELDKEFEFWGVDVQLTNSEVEVIINRDFEGYLSDFSKTDEGRALRKRGSPDLEVDRTGTMYMRADDMPWWSAFAEWLADPAMLGDNPIPPRMRDGRFSKLLRQKTRTMLENEVKLSILTFEQVQNVMLDKKGTIREWVGNKVRETDIRR
jgi:hypothetical protein